MIDAFHLPALAAPPATTWEYARAGSEPVRLRVPQLTPSLLERQIDALLDARERELAARPVVRIVRSVDRVARRLLDRGDALRRTADAALPAITGSSPEMIRLVLDEMAADWRGEPLERLLRSELGDPGVLDGFRDREGRRARAVGPRLTTHVFSGNIPGIAVTSLIRSLLVKSASVAKTAAGEPLLPALFARGLAEVDPALGECLAVTYWPGGDEEMERAALDRAGVVVAYGGMEAIAAVRARTPPAARFVGYGHRLSFGLVAREALAGDAAARTVDLAALDVATFDQHGCVSPHLFYLETGGEMEPPEWARRLAGALQRLETELPRGSLSPGEASSIRQLRGEAEFAQLSGDGTELHSSARGTGWTVVYQPDAAFEASCLNRVVRVKPVASLEEAVPSAAAVAEFLQTVGVAGPEARIAPVAERLAALGASRIAPLGSMAWPPPEWHHDGLGPLQPLLRWCDWEARGAHP